MSPASHLPVAVIFPSYRDPRIPMLGILTLFTILGQIQLGFVTSIDKVFLTVATTTVIDLGLGYWATRKIIIPISGGITGLSIGLLLNSVEIWPYLFAAIIASASKHAIKVGDRHIFNPSNIGVVLAIFLAGNIAVTTPSQWGGSLVLVFIIANLGIMMSYRAKQFYLSLSFIGSFVLFAFIRSILSESPLTLTLAPLLGVNFLVFTFFMITDPKTTPTSVRTKIIFGITIAILDAALRIFEIRNTLFLALFIASPSYFFIEQYVLPMYHRRRLKNHRLQRF